MLMKTFEEVRTNSFKFFEFKTIFKLFYICMIILTFNTQFTISSHIFYSSNETANNSKDESINSYQSSVYNEIRNCEAASFCDSTEPCSSNGMCYVDLFSYYNITNKNQKTRCICKIGWKSIDDHDVKCCYKKKHQAMAFLLEFVVGFGTGHWYIGNRGTSLIKMVFSAILCIIIWACAFFTLYKKGDYELNNKEKKGKKSTVYVSIMLSALLVYYSWQIIDAILFGINYYKDGIGHELQEW